jgi:hypothetical protein
MALRSLTLASPSCPAAAHAPSALVAVDPRVLDAPMGAEFVGELEVSGPARGR